QAGVPYVTSLDPRRVHRAPGGLPRDAVRALGLVPFSNADAGGHIKVACTAPVPRAALVALGRLTGWTPEPYLIADDAWPALATAYGAELSSDGDRSLFVKTASLSDAAARIAQAAALARSATVTEAHWDPYTWVRVQAPGAIRDVLVSHRPEEAECLAAP